MVSIMVAHPVKIVNNTGTAISNYQQMVVAPMCNNCANASVSNIFWAYDPAGASIIPSWLEGYIGSTVAPTNAKSGSLVYWLKIAGTISAGATQTVYMIFADRGTTVWDGTLTGVAPYFTSTYAQYDNGASVFNFYDNFAGTSLNTNKWSTSLGTATYTVNNGLSVSGSSTNAYFYGKIIQNYPAVFEVEITSNTGGSSQIRSGFSLTQGNAPNYDILTSPSSSPPPEDLESALGAFPVVMTNISSYPPIYIQSLAWINTGSQLAQVNYSYTLIGSNTTYSISNYYPTIMFLFPSSSGTYTTVSNWVRVRACTPNCTMPAVLF